jgi:hypothetical protein
MLVFLGILFNRNVKTWWGYKMDINFESKEFSEHFKMKAKFILFQK